MTCTSESPESSSADEVQSKARQLNVSVDIDDQTAVTVTVVNQSLRLVPSAELPSEQLHVIC